MARDPTSRRRLPPPARRRQLLEVGLELLDGEPEEAPSPGAVAQRAAVAPGLLYRYFPDKRAFHAALLAEAAERLAGATRWPPSGFDEALRASLRAEVRFAALHPGLWRALRGGSGGATLRRSVREEQAGRVLRRAGVARPSAAAGALLRGWVGFCAAAIEAWLEERALPEHELVRLLASALDPALVALGTRSAHRPRDRKPRVRLLGSARAVDRGSLS